MPGPAPKPASARARVNRSSTSSTLSVDRKVTDPPALPSTRAWSPMTAEWWADLWASPMAPEYDASDKHGLFVLAELTDDFWRSSDIKVRAALAAEIRLQRQAFGLTPIDRRRLQWEIDRGEDAAERSSKRRTPSAPKPGSPDARDVLRLA